MSQIDQVLSHAFRNSILVSAFVELFMDGLYTALVLFTFGTIFTRGKFGTSNCALLTVILLLYLMSITHLINHVVFVRAAYIEHAATSDDTYAYLTTPNSLSILSDVMTITMTFFADCILTWRVLVVWNCNWRVVMLPALLTILGFTFGAILTKIAHLPAEQINFVWAAKVSTIYYSATLATTIVSTLLIAGRVLHIGGTSGLGRYWHVLEVVVESAALYAIVLIIYMPYIVMTDILQSMPTYIIQAIVVPMTGIAPTLIVTRVALGLQKPGNSTWNPPIGSAFLQFGGATTIDTNAATLQMSGKDGDSHGEIDSPITHKGMV